MQDNAMPTADRRSAGILKNLSSNLQRALSQISKVDWDAIEEIRLRTNKPVTMETALKRHHLDKCVITNTDIIETLELMSESSIYAFLEEIKEGFLTLKGGHRVGICGRTILKNGAITNITNISGINIRIAKEIIGAANGIIDVATPQNMLIISPPNCGKTTVLRDIARQIGSLQKTCIVDERGEIAAMHQGQAQYDIGINTDVLDLCPKAIGINMMIRSMSPQVVIVDEIATAEDMQAVKNAVNCGVKIIASAHGSCLQDVKKRIDICDEIFEKIVILKRENGRFTHDEIDWSRDNPNS